MSILPILAYVNRVNGIIFAGRLYRGRRRRMDGTAFMVAGDLELRERVLMRSGMLAISLS